MPRGGKRPGAGAPKGNLNALKHGRRSRQFAELGALVAQSSVARETLIAISRRWEMENKKADYVASRILSVVVTRGLQRGSDGLIVQAPDSDGRSIIESALGQPPTEPEDPPKTERDTAAQSNTIEEPHKQSPTDTKSQ